VNAFEDIINLERLLSWVLVDLYSTSSLIIKRSVLGADSRTLEYDRQYKYNVTLRRVTCSKFVFVTLDIQHANGMSYMYMHVVCLAVPYFSFGLKVSLRKKINSVSKYLINFFLLNAIVGLHINYWL
jgi:hypothetical protein